ncbi:MULTISPECIES: outer membrane beta-barrel protein [Myxococcaceae]|uniref:outer membrane beta-barrel protein n=1 Tax=Myxococcaceae TaxID=31 RepID=UPI00188EE71C|nr:MULTISPECIES: outer membrane beta-barrel protein [Myxococcaceae]MBF5043099.1 outer membrane beta-barrel protein [Simulacricoccus sp. 17bor-14]
MHLASYVLPGLLALGLAQPVAAQDQPPVETPPADPGTSTSTTTHTSMETEPLEYSHTEHVAPVFGFVGGGPSIPMGKTGDRFNVGYGFNAGVGFNFNRYLGAQVEAYWSHYGVNGNIFNSTALDANHRMQYGTVDIVGNVVRSGPFTAYLLGGGGLYYRRVELTQFAGTTVVPVCDPWLFYCYPSAVSVETILGSRSSTDWGINGGVGFSVRVAGGLRLYAEGRYHYIFGPELANSNEHANGDYIPIMFGLRFE